MNRKTIFISFILLLLITLTVLAQEFLLIKTENEPLRTDPNGTVVTQIPKNTKLEVVESSDGWVKVKGKIEVTGWVKKEATTLSTGEQSSQTEIKGGFVYDNVSFEDAQGVIKVSGEMTNNSGSNYHIATFKITAYGESNTVVGKGYINIGNFKNGETKQFKAVLNGKFSEINKYKIEFLNN